MKTKNRSHKYDIYLWPRPRHGRKYSNILNIKMSQYDDDICIQQHLINIWSSVHTKVKQHRDWIEDSVAYKKTCSEIN